MLIPATQAAWFLAPVALICLYVCFTDLATMKIRNHAVLALLAVFIVLGALVMPLEAYLWRFAHVAVVLIIGFALATGGAMGAGDAKFAAAAAPFVHLGDVRLALGLFAATLLGAVAVHRLAKHSPLRRLAPEWKSWQSGARFPMGLALGGTLTLYLALGAFYGMS